MHDALQKKQPLFFVNDAKGGFGTFFPEQRPAEGVKSGGQGQHRNIVQQLLQARAHFAGRFIRKRQGHDRVGRHPAIRYQVGHAMGHGSGFAGSRTGYNQQGAVPVGNGLLLSAVFPIFPESGCLVGWRIVVWRHRHTGM